MNINYSYTYRGVNIIDKTKGQQQLSPIHIINFPIFINKHNTTNIPYCTIPAHAKFYFPTPLFLISFYQRKRRVYTTASL